MGWFSQFSLVMRSNITTLREKFEDPERMLHQLLIDMEEELEKVRHNVAGAIADEIQLGKQVEKAKREVSHWDERAVGAAKRGDATSAKAALEQKNLTGQRADGLDMEYRKQKEQTEKLRLSIIELEDKIRQARQKQTLLLARLARADSADKINRAIDRAQSKSAFSQFARLEQRADRAEALGEAYDRLEGRDPDAEELERQFEETDRKEKLEAEYEKLMRRVKEEV